MTIEKFNVLEFTKPSPNYKGENFPDSIHVEVGRALHSWEHMECALARLFQVLCESRSVAPSRAYGMLESSYTKHQVLIQACETFFGSRDPFDKVNADDVKAVLKSYQNAFNIRNNIAHGMCVGHQLEEDNSNSGYFLCPPYYASKKVKRHADDVLYVHGASYFYKARDIEHYSNEFVKILDEAFRLALLLNKTYNIVPEGDLHA